MYHIKPTNEIVKTVFQLRYHPILHNKGHMKYYYPKKANSVQFPHKKVIQNYEALINKHIENYTHAQFHIYLPILIFNLSSMRTLCFSSAMLPPFAKPTGLLVNESTLLVPT